MRAGFVDSADEQSHAEGTLRGCARLDLALAGNFDDKTLAGVAGAVRILVVHALIAHKFGQEARICCHSADGDSHVLIDLEHFLLVGSQIMWRLLQAHDHL